MVSIRRFSILCCPVARYRAIPSRWCSRIGSGMINPVKLVTDGLAPRIAEGRLRSSIESEDHAAMVGRDHGIERRFEQRALL